MMNIRNECAAADCTIICDSIPPSESEQGRCDWNRYFTAYVENKVKRDFFEWLEEQDDYAPHTPHVSRCAVIARFRRDVSQPYDKELIEKLSAGKKIPKGKSAKKKFRSQLRSSTEYIEMLDNMLSETERRRLDDIMQGRGEEYGRISQELRNESIKCEQQTISDDLVAFIDNEIIHFCAGISQTDDLESLYGEDFISKMSRDALTRLSRGKSKFATINYGYFSWDDYWYDNDSPVIVNPKSRKFIDLLQNGHFQDVALIIAANIEPSCNDFYSAAARRIAKQDDTAAYLMKISSAQNYKGLSCQDMLADAIRNTSAFEHFIDEVASIQMIDIIGAMRTNPYYEEIKDVLDSVYQKLEKKEQMRCALIKSMPDSIQDFYPLARKIKRRFILHIGATNSGKTYEACQALANAESGTYLAPLRLLAYERYMSFNENGVPCTLLTGEENVEVLNARIVSATIEMADLLNHYDVAVIDEGQMIADPFRGGAWTAAILGLCADEIHICGSQNMVPVITSIVEDCNDSLEIVQHERNTPLLFENEKFALSSVSKGDALIVFSRKKVHALAAELTRRGHKCSIIYGALPHTVRQNEAKRFATGETDIVVSTDAIGMGMNLPIRRIIFMETEKYDGQRMRFLSESEIQQIAGRAGRFGMYDTGYVNVIGGKAERNKVSHALRASIPAIDKAMLPFPRALLGIEGKLSSILKQWQQIDINLLYSRQSLEAMLYLAETAEEYTDDKELIYAFATMPCDIQDPILVGIWEDLLKKEISGSQMRFEATSLPVDYQESEDLEMLEKSYRICDLYYSAAYKMGHADEQDKISEIRQIINERIMHIVETQAPASKKCRYCGKALAWDFPYSMCNECHNQRYRGYYDWGYWEEDEFDNW